jgi:hypothetical protein
MVDDAFASGALKQHAPTGVRAHLGNSGYFSELFAMKVGFGLHRVGVHGEPFEQASFGIGLWLR